MSRTTKPRSPQSYTYVAVPITMDDGTDTPELVVCANSEGVDIYLNLTAVELRDLRQAGHKQERVRLPTSALDRFADENRWTVDKPDLYIEEQKGVLTIGFSVKGVWIRRELGVDLVKEAYDVRKRLINLGKDGSLGAFFKVVGVPAIPDEDRRPNRDSGQGQRQPDRGRRNERQPGNRQEQQGQRNGQGRNNAQGQTPRQPKAETPKVEAAPSPAPAVETPVETEVTTPTPVATQRPSQPRKARGERAVKKVTPGRNGERSTKLGDVFAGLKLPTGSKAAEEPAPTATADSACECQETIDPNTSNDAVEEKAPANAAEAAATPVANDQATETASDPVAGEVAETKEFGNALRKSVGDGTSAEQPITFTV